MRTGTRSFVLCLIVVVAVSAVQDTALADRKVTVTGARLIEYGLYERGAVTYVAQPGAPEGRVAITPEARLLRKTDTFEAQINTTFGIKYIISGAPKNAPIEVTVEIIRPESVDPATGEKSSGGSAKFKRYIGIWGYNDAKFDREWMLVPGEYKFRLLYQSRVLIEKSFHVTKAD